MNKKVRNVNKGLQRRIGRNKETYYWERWSHIEKDKFTGRSKHFFATMNDVKMKFNPRSSMVKNEDWQVSTQIHGVH
eukprot:gene7769-13613_t